MDEYFNTTLNKLKSNNYSDLTIVLGNESCDLDSAVSSLVYAIFLAWQHQIIKAKVCTQSEKTSNEPDEIFVSVLNAAREDYPLKTEVTCHFTENGVQADKLLFRDDLDLSQLVTEKSVKVILVDHHVLAKRDQFLAEYITEIIDHRPKDKTTWKYNENTRSTIETVGSCCTLVSQRIRDLSKLLEKGDEFFKAYPKCVEMLHSTIILDTLNFSKEFKKGTPQDSETVVFLEGFMDTPDVEAGRKIKLEHLSRAKADVSHLTASELIRKDLKVFETVLIPSFPILVQEFLQKPNCVEALSEALALRDCSAALLLGKDSRQHMSRDIAVYCKQVSSAKQLGTFLETWSSPPLELIPLPPPAPVACLYYKQLNVAATRKQYLPALYMYFNGK